VEHFEGRIAVVTGGGTGMGRELVRQLAAEGCDVATCDVSDDEMAETKALALEGAPDGTRVVTFVADVSDEAQILAFRDAVVAGLATDHINLIFNNAGIRRRRRASGDSRHTARARVQLHVRLCRGFPRGCAVRDGVGGGVHDPSRVTADHAHPDRRRHCVPRHGGRQVPYRHPQGERGQPARLISSASADDNIPRW
jgi:NAD(P)-dependent dehydrogenase (short-subunit alcohol dehydrogenase family)